jgi:hypothetical protein
MSVYSVRYDFFVFFSRERQEDSDVTAILSGRGFNFNQPNDLNKYLTYKDII